MYSGRSCKEQCRFPTSKEVLASVTKPGTGRRRLQQASGAFLHEPTSYPHPAPRNLVDFQIDIPCTASAIADRKSEGIQSLPKSVSSVLFSQGCEIAVAHMVTGWVWRAAGNCEDVAPATGADGRSYTCAQQAAYGKCAFGFMNGFCKRTCGRCPDITQPPATGTTLGPVKSSPCDHDYRLEVSSEFLQMCNAGGTTRCNYPMLYTHQKSG